MDIIQLRRIQSLTHRFIDALLRAAQLGIPLKHLERLVECAENLTPPPPRHSAWFDVNRVQIMVRLRCLGFEYEDLCSWAAATGQARPSSQPESWWQDVFENVSVIRGWLDTRHKASDADWGILLPFRRAA